MPVNPLDQLSPYDMRHLVAHLAAAGRDQEVHRLLALETGEHGNAWFSAHEAAGQMQDYLIDLQRAQRLAQQEPLAGPRFSQGLGLQSRYALITASLNSLAGNIPIDLLLRLVESGTWMPEQALALILQIPYQARQVHDLAALAPHFPEKERTQILDQALLISQEITDEDGQAQALKALAERLAALGRFEEAVSAARQIQDDLQLAQALDDIAPYLPESLLREILAGIRKMEHGSEALIGLLPRLAALGHPEEALVAVEQITDDIARRRVLGELGPYLPEENLREALSIARGITDQTQREVALAHLLPYLAEVGHIKEAFTSLQYIEYEWERADALARMAPNLPEKLLRKALSRKYWAGEDPPTEALVGLLPRLAELGHLKKALSIARKVNSPNTFHIEVLIALAPYLQEEDLQDVLSRANRLAYSSDQARALVALAPHLPETLQPAALSGAQQVKYENDKISVLAGLAPHLQGTILREALAIARQIGDEKDRAQAVARFLPHLAALGYSEASLTTVQQIGYAHHRAQALIGIAPSLTESDRKRVLHDALSAARQIKGEFDCAETLADLAALLPAPDRMPIIQEALARLMQIDDESIQQRVLARILPRLAELGDLQGAWSATLKIRYDSDRADALRGIAPFLPEALLRKALVNARQMENKVLQERALARLLPRLAELGNARKAFTSAKKVNGNYFRAIALAGIAPYLTGPRHGHLLQEALATVRQIQMDGDYVYWVGALLRLAPHLHKTLIQEMLADVLQIEDAEIRTEALAGLAPHLPGSERLQTVRQAVTAVRQIETTYSRAKALPKLTPLLTTLPFEELNDIWIDLIGDLSTSTRENSFSYLVALEPVLSTLGRGETLLEIVSAIQEVGKWWP
jgi:hypothetical protein